MNHKLRLKDYLLAAIIGEAVAWLSIATAKGAQLPIPYFSALVILPILFPILSVVGLFAAKIINKFVSFVLQAAKFVLVGALNTFIDLGIFNLLSFLTSRTTGYYSISFKATSFVVAVINSYFWNKFWTFHSEQVNVQEKPKAKEFSQFLIVSVVGFLINIAIFSLFATLVGPKAGLAVQTWNTVSAVLATAASLIWNFIGYKFFVFKPKQESPVLQSQNTGLGQQ